MSADFAATPCNRWLGFELIARSEQRVEVRQPRCCKRLGLFREVC